MTLLRSFIIVVINFKYSLSTVADIGSSHNWIRRNNDYCYIKLYGRYVDHVLFLISCATASVAFISIQLMTLEGMFFLNTLYFHGGQDVCGGV
jgi:hypothetical protein